MIIFINGAFGIGKTTVAELLISQLPNSMLYDPEEVGSFLRNIVRPIDNFKDYQDLSMWRTLVVTTAKLLKETYGRTLIVPMTVWYEPYFDEIIEGLRQIEPNFHHFCLIATQETLRQRIHSRDFAQEWSLQNIDRCTKAFCAPKFAKHIETDSKTPDEITIEILSSVNKKLSQIN